MWVMVSCWPRAPWPWCRKPAFRHGTRYAELRVSMRRSVLAFLAVFAWAGPALAAPTVAINTSGVIRLASNETTQIPSLIVHSNQQGINFKECIDDTFVRFP